MCDNEPNSEVENTRRLLFQMDSIFHQRINFLLVVETIFFAAAATVFDHFWALFVMAASGIVISALFTFPNLKLYWRVTWLIERLKILDPSYADYIRLKESEPFDLRFGWITKCLFRVVRADKPTRSLDSGCLYTWWLLIVVSVAWVSLIIAGCHYSPSSKPNKSALPSKIEIPANAWPS